MQIPLCIGKALAISGSLATIGVCVFCAVTSVAALFVLRQVLKIKKKEKSKLDVVFKFITSLISLATLILSVLIFRDAAYRDDLILNQPDNLIVNRIQDSSGTMLYSVESAENAHRYNEVQITPILHLYCKNSDDVVINECFAYLNNFYIDTLTESEKSIVAFKDFSHNGITYDNVFRYAARYYNISTNELYVDCDIVYQINFKYLNNKNEYQNEFVALSRSSTAIDLSSKDKLTVNQDLKEKLIQHLEGSKFISFNSIEQIKYQGYEPNCLVNPTETIVKSIEDECLDYIEKFQNAHGIIAYYNAQSDSLS